MDRIFTCKNQNSYRTLRGPLIRPEDRDPNDTIDCFTLPEIDIPHEQLCCYTQLPGVVPRFGGENSERISALDTRGTNTCNTLSPEISQLHSDFTDSKSHEKTDTVDDISKTISTPVVPNSSGKLDRTMKVKGHWPNSNVSANRLNIPETDIGFESNDQLFVLSKSNWDSSNASKPPPSKRENRPHSGGAYAKHVSAPPKWRPRCSSRKQTPRSASSVDIATEERNVPKSVVYVTKEPGSVYQLEFYTKNTVASPLYVDERIGIQAPNEKKIQPPHYEYRDRASRSELAPFFVRRKFAVNTDGSRPKPYKYVLPPLRVYTDEVSSVHRRTSSETSKGASHGNIYFFYKEMLFRIRTTPMTISQIKTPVREEVLAQMAKLNMPSSESRKNKGVIVGRWGFDLTQFTFDMDQISLNRIEMKGTAAVQTEDKMVYIRERSKITGRLLLLALPESTYFYRDPMATIHRLHTNFQRTNVMPLWKYELMKSRLAERRGALDTEAKIDRVFKQTRGSRLFFEGLDALITAQGGLMCYEVTFGQDKYEAMMQNEYSGQNYYRKKALQYTVKKRKSNTVSKGQSFEEAPETAVITQMEGIENISSDDKD